MLDGLHCAFFGLVSCGRMLQRVGRERVVFGSHFPLFNPESALLEIRESALSEAGAKAAAASGVPKPTFTLAGKGIRSIKGVPAAQIVGNLLTNSPGCG